MDDPANGVVTARRILLQRLESLQRAGVEQIRKVPLGAALTPVVAGSPDPATAPTAGLLTSQMRGDLRSAFCAASGDPRTTGSESSGTVPLQSGGLAAEVQSDKQTTFATRESVRS